MSYMQSIEWSVIEQMEPMPLMAFLRQMIDIEKRSRDGQEFSERRIAFYYGKLSETSRKLLPVS